MRVWGGAERGDVVEAVAVRFRGSWGGRWGVCRGGAVGVGEEGGRGRSGDEVVVIMMVMVVLGWWEEGS